MPYCFPHRRFRCRTPSDPIPGRAIERHPSRNHARHLAGGDDQQIRSLFIRRSARDESTAQWQRSVRLRCRPLIGLDVRSIRRGTGTCRRLWTRLTEPDSMPLSTTTRA